MLIVLGVVCIANPSATLISTAWLIGCLTLISGISRLVFTCRTQAFLPNSGTGIKRLEKTVEGIRFNIREAIDKR